ncbi:MAG: asparagine synthase (glutamine-hydrolyzing) [Proteobacteria bacterium]|nr:asparagine synthase (glutamine-hydrolyzing) [Pseudomonadota bacterium]
MCGIAGQLALQAGTRVAASDVVAMAAALAHRGPDGWGHRVSPDGRAMLVHTRLSIVDVEGGGQPLANEDGSVWAVCNGELYDHVRMRRALERRGHRFRTRSDSELVVHLYEEYGEDFARHLRGEFAIALLDERGGRTYLVRDRFGVKPLFVAIAGGRLCFASEMKALFAVPGLRAEIDATQLWHMLGTVASPTATLFRGVEQIEPGSWLRVDAGGMRKQVYWDYLEQRRASAAGMAALSRADRAELFLSKLDESVRLRLQADVEVGSYLSGGVDSASIATLAARAGVRPLRCFTVGLPGAFDESAPARHIADALNVEWHVREVSTAELTANFERSLWHSEAPTPNAHGTAKFLLSELAQRHVKVVLTGEGADELLGGYAHFQHIAWLEGSAAGDADAKLALDRLLASGAAATGLVFSDRWLDHDAIVGMLGAYPYAALRNRWYRGKAAALLSRPLRAACAGTDSIAALAGALGGERLRGLTPLDASEYLGIKTDLANYMLGNLGDRQEMAHSVEGRVPYLDHEFAAVAGAMPWEEKLHDGIDKRILREAMQRRGGHATTAPKKVFLAPTIDGYAPFKASALTDRYLSHAALRDAGYFDPMRIGALRTWRSAMPVRSRLRASIDNVLTFVLSIQVLHGLFCVDFDAALRRFRAPMPPAEPRTDPMPERVAA